MSPATVAKLTRVEKRAATKPLRHPRACDGCGDIYSRRTRVEAWTVQNQGHRIGWVKTVLKLCTKRCSPAEAAQRLIKLARQSSH